MKNINFLRLTTISIFLFVISILVYYGLSVYVYNSYDSTEEISKYVVSNYKTLLELEPIIKQSLLSITTALFGMGIAQNILKLTNINERFKKVYFVFSLVIVWSLTALTFVTIFYADVSIYKVSTFLMFLMTIIWITTIIIDYIKTKNDYQSIFIRIALAVLGVILVISVGDKVVNDYKVNVTLFNAYEYKIEQLEKQLEFVDEESKEWINGQIDYYENIQLTLYSNGLYSGKSAFFMYNELDVDLFGSDRLVQRNNAVKVIEDLLSTALTDDTVNFESYDINPGLYVGGDTTKVIMVLILVLGILCSFNYPLIRDDQEEENLVNEMVTVKFIQNKITKEEFSDLMKKLE